MERYIALLRGVNVSGKNIIKMSELCNLLSESGLGKVKSYIQSGNLCIQCRDKDQDEIRKLVVELIKHNWGFEVPVQVFSETEVDQIIAYNPFVKEGFAEDYLHVTLLENFADESLKSTFLSLDFPGETFRFQGNTIYLYLPNGYGNAKLNNGFIERKLKSTATTRNWKTMKKLNEMIFEF